MPSIDTLAQAYARKRKPPRQQRGGGPAYFIPGFGEQRSQRIHGPSVAHDNSVPRFQSSTPRQPAPYRPGERFKRKHPYRNQRGDAGRAHRPQLN